MLEGYGTGAVDYLHKPVNAAVLRSKVAVFAELHRKSREVEVGQPRPARRSDRAAPRRGAAARAEREPRPARRRAHPRARAARGRAARGRPAQGRVPRHAGPRAAQSARPGAQRRAAAAVPEGHSRRRRCSARDVIARQVAGDVAPDRRPDGREPHQPGPDRAAPRARRPGRVVELAVESSRPSIARVRPRAGARACPRRRSCSTPIRSACRRCSSTCSPTPPSTPIAAAASSSPPSVEGGEVRITVSDDGIGIPANELPNVFDMFAQVEGALTRSRGGLGIGLTPGQASGGAARRAGRGAERRHRPGQRVRRHPAASRPRAPASVARGGAGLAGGRLPADEDPGGRRPPGRRREHVGAAARCRATRCAWLTTARPRWRRPTRSGPT